MEKFIETDFEGVYIIEKDGIIWRDHNILISTGY